MGHRCARCPPRRAGFDFRALQCRCPFSGRPTVTDAAAELCCRFRRNSNLGPTFTGPLQDAESMPTLPNDIKAFIVRSLACFDSPSEVVEAVKVNFDIT